MTWAEEIRELSSTCLLHAIGETPNGIATLDAIKWQIREAAAEKLELGVDFPRCTKTDELIAKWLVCQGFQVTEFLAPGEYMGPGASSYHVSWAAVE